jgi:hypothetical protein
MITNDARGTREIKSRIAMAKAAFNSKQEPLPPLCFVKLKF